jgi:hypothetical protein
LFYLAVKASTTELFSNLSPSKYIQSSFSVTVFPLVSQSCLGRDLAELPYHFNHLRQIDGLCQMTVEARS